MSAFTAEQSIIARALERQEARRQRRQAKKRRSVDSPDAALRTLCDKSAPEADRLRAWLRIGSDLGALNLDATKLGALYR